jgi:membrane dipeptidase
MSQKDARPSSSGCSLSTDDYTYLRKTATDIHPVNTSRRRALKAFGAGMLGAMGTSALALSPNGNGNGNGSGNGNGNGDGNGNGNDNGNGNRAPILMDGHVHATSRQFWLGTDVWTPQPSHTGWDFARASAAGVNVIIENLSTYSYWNYNYTPKQTLRLIENFHEIAEAHKSQMGVALTVADARKIVASGRMAVFLSVESGWDHEGDIDVLRSFYRLGLRAIQFSTQTGFNNLADFTPTTFWGGVSPHGKDVIAEANRLGMVLDITHASPAAQAQIISLSRAPVLASHLWAGSVTGPGTGGLTDALIEQLAAKGGMMGIHGGAASIGKRYKAWMAANPSTYAKLSAALTNLVGFTPSYIHNSNTDNYGSYIARFDQDNRNNWAAVFQPFVDDPVALTQVPTADEWAEQAAYVIQLVGPDYVGIGLDMFGGRSGVPADPDGYPDLVAALNRITTPANVKKIQGENWLRVLDQIFSMAD